MRLLFCSALALLFASCVSSNRLTSNGALPDVPAKPRVLLVAQDMGAQRFMLQVSRAVELVGMVPYLDGTVTRAIEGPNRTATTLDTVIQTRTQLPYTTALYPTPATDLTMLLSSNVVGVNRFALGVQVVDSESGRLLYSLQMRLGGLRNQSELSSTLIKELRLAQARGRGIATGGR